MTTTIRVDERSHRRTVGDIYLGRVEAVLPGIQAAFVDACRELGYPPCADSNAPGSIGVGPHTMNKIDGRRIRLVSSAQRSRKR